MSPGRVVTFQNRKDPRCPSNSSFAPRRPRLYRGSKRLLPDDEISFTPFPSRGDPDIRFARPPRGPRHQRGAFFFIADEGKKTVLARASPLFFPRNLELPLSWPFLGPSLNKGMITLSVPLRSPFPRLGPPFYPRGVVSRLTNFLSSGLRIDFPRHFPRRSARKRVRRE